jgi:hypothetical protein
MSKESLGALGYEPSDGRNFNNLQDAGGAQSHCKEGRGTDIDSYRTVEAFASVV